MKNRLFRHQEIALDQLKTGSILQGGVGSGKSRVAIMYYYIRECGGNINNDNLLEMKKPKDLYIITTAKKRDAFEWEHECIFFKLSKDKSTSINNVQYVVDSWNNIKKYINIENSFFIFDEQRVIGHGTWVRSFLKIVKKNNWVLLTATPGDTWMDYIPVFIANGFYRNRTEFIDKHVIYKRFLKFPKIDRYIAEGKLQKLKNDITISMDYQRSTITIVKDMMASVDMSKLLIVKKRWNPYENLPIKNIGEYCYTMRRVTNSDPSRISIIRSLIEKHKKLIVFYNFNYELYILRQLKEDPGLDFAEYNGHKHEKIPETIKWVYIVQYTSGSEGWNCIETNAVAFYSQNYSYRIMTQAAGRIDRLNTPFAKLYYYNIISESPIDIAIAKALKNKKDFNESTFEDISQKKHRV